MRRFIRYLLLSLCLLSVLPVLAIGPDANSSGGVSPSDAMYVINRMGQAVDGGNQGADVNGDTAINDDDVNTVLLALEGHQIPTASFTYACTDFSCSFDASASDDTDGTIVEYRWQFGDSTSDTRTPPTAYHTYSINGAYDVILTVYDNDGASHSSAQTISISVANSNPKSFIAASCSNLECSFDASGAYDEDGTVVQYQWDFGDSSTSNEADPHTTHTFANNGTFNVFLTVVDNVGGSGSNILPLAVADGTSFAAPSASFNVSCVDLGCTFDANGSFDDGTITEYSWKFGDNVSPIVTTSPLIYHQYTTYTDYLVTLTVKDNDNLTNRSAGRISLNEPPTAAFTYGCTARACSFDASTSVDNDGVLDSYQWNFDDGTQVTSNFPTINHTFTFAGDYDVTLVVTDNESAIGQTMQTLSFAGNQPPIGDFVFDCTNLTCDFDASNSTDDGAITFYEWDFNSDFIYDISGATPTAQYTFPGVGIYDVTLRVTDNGSPAIQDTYVREMNFVSNAQPNANFSYNCTDAACNFNGSSSSDADGSIIEYSWDFDDDSVPDFVSASPLASYEFPATGVYPVTLTVRDDSPLNGYDSLTVPVLAQTVEGDEPTDSNE